MRENNQQCRIPPPPGLQKAAQISKVGKFKPSPRFIQVMLMRSMPLEKLEKHIKYLQTEPLTSICIVFYTWCTFFCSSGKNKGCCKNVMPRFLRVPSLRGNWRGAWSGTSNADKDSILHLRWSSSERFGFPSICN